ncbi:beta-ketoacyl synthase N-terminal-like domain-containing protein [Flavobacterium caeni]|uniref:3-oxoacyl-[acyl-carrier-protein] synthase-1 n=1 Tax=Flavobacterium caeni TaxID=490189 RepID=A0A1G5H6I4_9FLAO|nr:beta-ketoacyl synthase N-terminal-like domain-containing protein [Flavobacterium caeni]SCY59129.1 3-oxoacyl-[acyl-carrier-protein] synthase-1 [Flavobacterium caeni]
MTKSVYISATNCITPLGWDATENAANILAGKSGIARHENNMMPQPYYAGIVDDVRMNQLPELGLADKYTKLEKMLILALTPIIAQHKPSGKSLLLLSTTKGNIDALAVSSIEQAQLAKLAQTVADFFGFTTQPVVVSNACVSGILAVAIAKRMIQADVCDDAFVVAGDLVTEFVLSGFNSFQAMSDAPCKPYSAHRTGVTLGEATAAVYVTSDPNGAKVRVSGDGAINDANHISGPSRTGEGLFLSIQAALKEAQIGADQIDYISAHGTATPFNDEMEAIAFNRAGLQDVPVNSLKGYYGHTLGASGLLELVIAIESMHRNTLFASLGFDELGVSQPINVIEANQDCSINKMLKTASGFGGCNTAVIIEKVS